ncbi:MAG: ankyrin repeat domain-containing protein [Tatlockia sp.]|nr:ankyrin repeat domain-containing protein [Tatlockia sp.]
MLEFYLAQLKKNITSTSQVTNVFLKLIKHFEISKLKELPDFNDIKASAITNLTADEVFHTVAISLVRQNKNLANIQFLIEVCLFDLKQCKDENDATLLHEACLHGSTDVARYLLEKGFNVNAQDVNGATPVHHAVQFKNNGLLITLLKEHKANLNAKDNQGMAPVHLAAARQNFSAITELKNGGANLKLKFNNMTYLELSRNIKNNQIQISSLPTLASSEDPEYKIESKCYYGILHPKLDKEIFNEIITSLSNKPGTLCQEEAILFVDSFVLLHFSSSFDMNVFQQFILTQISKQKLTLKEAVIAILRPALFFSSGNFQLLVVQLLDIALELLAREVNQSAELIQLYNAIIVCCNQVGAHQEALQISLKAQSMLCDDMDNTTKSYVFYNLGRSQQNHGNMQDSVENLRRAFELLSDDLDIFRSYLLALLQKRSYSEATLACQSSKCGEFTRISQLVVSYLAGELSSLNALKAVEKDSLNDVAAQSFIFTLRAKCYLNLKDYSQALEISKAGFDYQEKFFQTDYSSHYETDIAGMITTHLALCIDCNDYTKALEFTQDCMKKYPVKFSSHLTLMSFMVMIYTASHRYEEAEEFIKKIENVNPEFYLLSDLYLQLGIEQIDNLAVALHYFELALKCDADNRVAQIHRILVLLLTKPIQQPEMPSENIADIFDNFANESSEEDIVAGLDAKVSEYDPQKIHQYFQTQKQQCRLNLSRKLLPENLQPKIKWKIKDSIFSEEESNIVALNSDFYPDHYAVIDPQLKMDEKVLERFQMALKKGVCSRRLGQNGIKILKNSIMELKIDDDIRLYTTVIYKNSNNKSLILFDKIGDHEFIKKLLLEKNPLKIIELTECKDELIPISGFSGGLFANLKSTALVANYHMNDKCHSDGATNLRM